MNETNSEAILRYLEVKRSRAMITRDIETLRLLMDESLVYKHTNGLRDNRDSYLKKLSTLEIQYTTLSFNVYTVTVGHQFALMTGAMDADVLLNKTPIHVQSTYESTWMRTIDSWALLAVSAYQSK